MPSITFYTNDTEITGSNGLGFYGNAGFGSSVSVDSYQGSTFITNSTGTLQGAAGNNIKFLNSGSGYPGVIGSGIGVDALTNDEATLQIRFTHTGGTEVQCQNAEFRIYDRSSIGSSAVGVLTKVAELHHPDTVRFPATADTFEGSGAGNGSFNSLGGVTALTLSPSPGPLGIHIGDGTSTHESATHDWYLALSAAPASIGSKTEYGAYVSLEYL